MESSTNTIKTKIVVKRVKKRVVSKSPPELKAISLFSGMGGDTLGMIRAGVQVVAFNEFDKHALASHQANFPHCELICDHKGGTDIMSVPDEVLQKYCGEVDLVFAGFPCQGFSHGGKKLPEDPRNTLFREFVRVASCVRPRFVIGENVDGLLSRKTSDGRNFIDVIEEAFVEIGYRLKYKVCHAVRHGVPQLRKRLIIVGVRDDVAGGIDAFEFPKEQNDGKNGLPGLKGILRYDLTGCAAISPEQFDFEKVPRECILENLKDKTEPSGLDVHPYVRLKLDTPAGSVSNAGKIFDSLLSFGKRESPYHVEVVDLRGPSKTIICTYDHQPRLLAPIRNATGFYVRTLLPDELKQIQGFPSDFVICGNVKQQIKQIGNAVPPPLIEAIVNQIRSVYEC